MPCHARRFAGPSRAGLPWARRHGMSGRQVLRFLPRLPFAVLGSWQRRSRIHARHDRILLPEESKGRDQVPCQGRKGRPCRRTLLSGSCTLQRQWQRGQREEAYYWGPALRQRSTDGEHRGAPGVRPLLPGWVRNQAECCRRQTSSHGS